MSDEYRDQVLRSLALLPGHLLVGLLAAVALELERRGDVCGRNYVTRAASAHAAFITGPDAPSDNGYADYGDNEADA